MQTKRPLSLLRALLWLLSIPVIAGSTWAMEPNQWFLESQTLGRGFDPTKHYVPGLVDSINTYNGNLTISLPLGPRYTIREGFTYGFTLTYNATHWDFDEARNPDTSDPDNCTFIAGIGIPMLDANAGMGWKLTLGELYPPLYDVDEPAPYRDVSTRNPNKGKAWMFVAPDGRRHSFHTRRIHPDGNGGVPIEDEIFYTTDGTFARLHTNPLDHPPGHATVETGDGLTYLFENFDPTADQNHGRWRLVRIFDPFSRGDGEGVVISYPSGERVWIVSDEQGRRHRVEFSEAPDLAGPHYPRVVQGLSLAGFDGNGDTANALQYLFRYELASVGRPDGHHAEWEPWNGPAEDVPLLTELILPGPGAQTPEPQRERFRFAYYGEYPDGLTHPPTSTQVGGKLGWLRLPTGGEQGYEYQDYDFPNEARVDASCGPFTPGTCQNVIAPTHSNVGVRRKTTWDPVRNPEGDAFDAPTAEWFYHHLLTDRGPVPNCLLRNYQDSRTFVFSPWSKGTGNDWVAEVYYYGQYLVGDTTSNSGVPWTDFDLSQPYTKALSPADRGVEDPLYPGDGELFLSRESYQCEGGGNPLDPATFAGDREDLAGMGCEPLEASYVRYTLDGFLISLPEPAFFDQNRRLEASRTVTFRNGVAQSKVDTTLRDWDGLGHYRTQVTAGNWDREGESYLVSEPDQWATRVVSNDFNPEAGSVGSGQPPVRIPAPSEPWLLELSLGTSVQEKVDVDRTNGELKGPYLESLRTDTCFSAETGVLLGARTRRTVNVSTAISAPDQRMDDPALAPTDQLTIFDYDALGNLVAERLFGGDGAQLPTDDADPCAFGTEAPAFQRSHSYYEDNGWQTGIRQTTWVQDACSGSGDDVLRTLHLTGIERRTGLVTRSVDPAGLVTTADYDHRGRMTRLDLPGSDDPIIFQYLRYGGTNPTSPARVVVKQGDVSTADGTEEKKTLDGFGRPVEELRALPANAGHARRVIDYYAAGPLLRESTLFQDGRPGGPPGFTRTDYDGLGRVFEVTQPDHSASDPRQIETDWFGVRTRWDHFSVHTEAGTSATSRLTVFDPHGRILQVREASGDSLTTLLKTDYHYGADGALLMVDVPGNRKRRFLRDGAGLLRWEEHPEIAGRVIFGDYDAHGQPGYRHHRKGGNTVEMLTFHYDPIGRLVRTRDSLAGRDLSEHTLEPGTGRLLAAKRHNWIPVDPDGDGESPSVRDVVITRLFDYDSSGRLNEERLRTNTGVSFLTRYTHDRRGNVRTVEYPVCFSGAECAGVAPARRVTYTYDKDQLHSVSAQRRAGGVWSDLGVVSSTTEPPIQYHPNGLIRSMSFANGVKWNQEIGAEEMARPTRIFTENAVGSAGNHTGDWDSGTIEYDPSGNLFRVGNDQYSYDGVGRLTRATVEYPSSLGTGTATVSYSYDRQGNLLRVDGGPSAIDFQVDPFTNRLLPGSEHPYDPQGNLLRFGTSTFTYDPLGRVTTMEGVGVDKTYLYDASGERVAVLDRSDGGTVQRWSLRGADGQLLRQVTRSSGTWSHAKDFVRGSSGLLATIEDRGGDNETIRYFHNDHLGTPRLITNRAIPGQVVSYHEYLPFGWELTDPNQDDEPIQFTGHERDRNLVYFDGTGADREDDLDYMHARYYTPLLRRFLSVDSVLGRPEAPQSWNRYAYVRGNPLRLVDPDGNEYREASRYRNGSKVDLTGLSFKEALQRTIEAEQPDRNDPQVQVLDRITTEETMTFIERGEQVVALSVIGYASAAVSLGTAATLTTAETSSLGAAAGTAAEKGLLGAVGALAGKAGEVIRALTRRDSELPEITSSDLESALKTGVTTALLPNFGNKAVSAITGGLLKGFFKGATEEDTTPPPQACHDGSEQTQSCQ